MFDGDKRGEKIDLKENAAPSGEESFMLLLDQKCPFALLVSAAFVLLSCCLAANKDLGEDILAHNPVCLPETQAGRARMVEYQIGIVCEFEGGRVKQQKVQG